MFWSIYEQIELAYAGISPESSAEKKYKENNILIHYGELDDMFYERYSSFYRDFIFYPLNKIYGYEETNYNVLTERFNYCDSLGDTLGLISDEIPVLNMFLYDEAIFESLNLPSPQKLYQEGLWTVDKFIEYISLLDKENYLNIISPDYFVQAIANYKGEYLVDFDNKIINFDDEENIINLNKLKELEKKITLHYFNNFSKTKEDEDKMYGFVSCNLLDQTNKIIENENTNYSFVPYPYESISENNFVSSTYNCYAIYNNYNFETNGITYEMLYSIIKDLSSGFNNILKYSKERLYEICENDNEKNIINYYLNTKLLFDGVYVANRHKSILGTNHYMPNCFKYYLDNVNDYNEENISNLIKEVITELKRIIFLEE